MIRLNSKKILSLLPIIFLSIVFTFDLFNLFHVSLKNEIFLIRELLIICSVILSSWHLYDSRFLTNKNIIQKIKLLFVCIGGIYFSLYIPKLFLSPVSKISSAGIIHIYSSFKMLMYATITSALTTIFIIFIFLILRDLVFIKRKRSTYRNFVIILYLMGFQLIFLLSQKPISSSRMELTGDGTIGIIILIILIAIFVTNSFRNSWVNFLNKRQKLICFGSGLILLPASYLLIGLSPNKIIMFYSSSLSIVIRQIVLFFSIYWSMAMLSILSHLPTAGLYDRKTKEIDSLHKLSRSITLEFDPDKLVIMITIQSSEVIEANRVWLEIWDHTNRQFTLASSYNLTNAEQNKIRSIPDNIISEWILENRNAVIVNEAIRDVRTQKFMNVNPHIGSLLGVPLISYEKFLGILYAVKLEEYGFSDDDRKMLQAFADQAAIALENARLVKESIIKERLEQELKIAHDAQMKLLPKSMPKMERLDIDAICVTANEVGGDYYDFFKFDEHRLAIIIGDVSGKGPEAAFYMAEVKGIIESLSKIYSSPKEILIKTNEILYENWDKKAFTTMIYSVIDVREMKITHSRAGHCPLILFDYEKGTTNFIQLNGIGLGLEKGLKFKRAIEEKTILLKTNDVVVFYTDGVVEARNAAQEDFGEHKLLESVSTLTHLSPSKIRKELAARVQEFEGKAKPHDDLTIIVVKLK